MTLKQDKTMPPEKWQALKVLFEAALGEDPARRGAFLERCPDATLRAEVERLLAEHDHLGNFLSTPMLGDFPLRAGPTRGLSPGEVLAGRFHIIRYLAGGGMGEVYEAEDQELRERVAVKIIRPEVLVQSSAVARFKREVHLARKVTHPNVCRIFDLFRHKSEGGDPRQDLIFISMELLNGKTLSTHLEKVGRMNVGDALPLIQQMASALTAAHAVGIVHRDFKPGNVVLVGTDGQENLRPVVTDFGLALQSLVSNEAVSLSTDQGLMGTPAYMAPEQIEGRPATPASDIYAFGLVIYEMVTGARPFQGDTPISAALKRLSELPTPPRKFQPRLSAAWESAILRCLERDPNKRFLHAADVARAITSEDAGINPSVAASWPEETLRKVEQQLAVFLGPVAKIAVKRAACKTTDLTHLYELLAPMLDRELDRQAFLAGRSKLSHSPDHSHAPGQTQLPQESSSIAHEGTSTNAASEGEVTPAAIERATNILARHVGPISGVLAKRAAQRADCLRSLYLILAEHVENKAERARFLKDAGFPAS
jgi:serine/threonine protein kinase